VERKMIGYLENETQFMLPIKNVFWNLMVFYSLGKKQFYFTQL